MFAYSAFNSVISLVTFNNSICLVYDPVCLSSDVVNALPKISLTIQQYIDGLQMASFTGIGCMSGSSLDGLDLCLVEFTGDIDTDVWGYRIVTADTVQYTPEWEEKLRNASKLSGEELIKLHTEYGHLLGREVKSFITGNSIASVDFVASHGHTIFHNPKSGYTFQLGDGETTSAYLDCPFVCNFRTKDVALGGQGAPFVPCGEKYLFSTHHICINLGGIANIGLNGKQGYDVCPCNFVSNKLARAHDKELSFDRDGHLAAKGNVLPEVLQELENLPYYQQKPPKSLGVDWIEGNILPALNMEKYSIPDLLKTYTEHVTNRLADACVESKQHLELPDNGIYKILVTGGGAFNETLIKSFKKKLEGRDFEVESTDRDTICFKEALIFAFLGFRSLLGEENIFREVTGCSRDHVSGSIHLPAASQNTPGKLLRANFELKRRRARVSSSYILQE